MVWCAISLLAAPAQAATPFSVDPYALQFDGINDSLRVADSATLDITNQLTIEAWVYPTSNNGVVNGIVPIIVNKENSYEVARGANGNIYFAIQQIAAPVWQWVDSGVHLLVNNLAGLDTNSPLTVGNRTALNQKEII